MSDTTISGAQIVADLEPYIVAFIGAVITAGTAIITYQVQKYTGIRVDQTTAAKIDKYVEDLAAKEVAKTADNLATHEIDVHSPVVASVVNKVVADLPGELKKVGLGPDDVATKATAAFGRLQAQMTTVSVPPLKTES